MGQLFSSSEKKKSTTREHNSFHPVVRHHYEPSNYQPYGETSYNVARPTSNYSGRPVHQTISNFPREHRSSVTSVASGIGERTNGYQSVRSPSVRNTTGYANRQPIRPQYSNATSVSSVNRKLPYEHTPATGYVNSSRLSNVGYLNSHGRLQVDTQYNIAPRTRNAKTITLYHYTTDQNANTIRREKVVRSSTTSTPWKYRQHGCGVYFTSLDPYVDPTILALNNFTNGGTHVTYGLYRKICSVVEITFYEHEVEKIQKGHRNIYLYRGSIDLRNYEGRYRIYENPNYS